MEVNESTRSLIESEDPSTRSDTQSTLDSRDDTEYNLNTSIAVYKICLKKPGFSSIFIFNNLSFELPIGKSLLIKGENGVGKTSLMRLLAGLWKPDSGKLKINSSYKTMFIQETPVLTDGTLLQQLIYPKNIEY